nr:RNA-directed DNA polymerase, eukaryota, nucleotide-binding alpha-beta plait domain protein [Tanacetum cinerariifolium]
MVTKVHSNADLTRTISKFVFVTNFPDNTTSVDLWKICQTYGVVVDVYIPNCHSKVGKRFAFVRFIKVTNVERLVGNLCTLWIGKCTYMQMSFGLKVLLFSSLNLPLQQDLNGEEGLEKPIHQTNVEEESDVEAISETFFGDQADDLNDVVD